MVLLFLSLLSAGGGDLSAAAGRSMDALNRQMSFCTAAVQQHINMFGPLPLLGAQIWPQAALAAMVQQQQQLHEVHASRLAPRQLPSTLLPAFSFSYVPRAPYGLPSFVPLPQPVATLPRSSVMGMEQLLSYVELGMLPSTTTMVAATNVV